MPQRASALKALKRSEKRRIFNLRRKDAMKKAIKDFKKLIKQNKIKEAQNFIPILYKAIDKAAKKGVIKKNTAARKKSRLLKLLNEKLVKQKS